MSRRSHVCLGTTRRVSHLTLTATLQETCKPTQQERLADSCQHKLESDKKNPLKRRKHRAKTVRCFPLLSAFGSRFGSNAFAAWLVDIHTQFHIVKILLHHDSPRKHPMAHLFTIIRDLKHLHVQRPSAVLADCSINTA